MTTAKDIYLPTRAEVYEIYTTKNYENFADAYTEYEIFKIFKKYVTYFKKNGYVFEKYLTVNTDKATHKYSLKEQVCIDIIWDENFNYQLIFRFDINHKEINQITIKSLSIIKGILVEKVFINNNYELLIMINIEYYVRAKKIKALLKGL